MVKTLRFSLFCLLAMVCAVVSADTYSYSFTEKTFTAAGTQKLGDIEWTLTTDAGYFGYDANTTDKGQQFGSKSKPATSVKLSTSGISGTISSIKVKTSGASNINATLDVTVGGAAFGSQYTLTKTSTETAFEGSAKGEIVLTYTNSSSIAIYLKSIEVVYTPEGGVTKKSAGLSFSATTAKGTIGTEFTAPTLTKETTADVTYSSSDEKVATVDASTGAVTLVAAGTTTITAKAEANDDYEAGTASYTLTVQSVDITNTPETAYTVAKANELIAANDGLDTKVYVKGTIVSIKEVSTNYGNATYYISDDGSATDQLTVFRGYYLNGDNFSSEDQIKAGDKVVVYGKLVNYNGTYEMNSGNQIYSINNVTTAITTVKAASEANAPIYNLAGQRLVKAQKGLNIVGGKKVIKK